MVPQDTSLRMTVLGRIAACDGYMQQLMQTKQELLAELATLDFVERIRHSVVSCPVCGGYAFINRLGPLAEGCCGKLGSACCLGYFELTFCLNNWLAMYYLSIARRPARAGCMPLYSYTPIFALLARVKMLCPEIHTWRDHVRSSFARVLHRAVELHFGFK